MCDPLVSRSSFEQGHLVAARIQKRLQCISRHKMRRFDRNGLMLRRNAHRRFSALGTELGTRLEGSAARTAELRLLGGSLLLSRGSLLCGCGFLSSIPLSGRRSVLLFVYAVVSVFKCLNERAKQSHGDLLF